MVELNDKGKQRVEEFRIIEGIPNYFRCPECEITRETKLKVEKSKATDDNWKTHTVLYQFDFQCPKCWFSIGGGSLKEDEIKLSLKQERMK